MLHVLFICGRNQWRSPTAEQVFADWSGIEVASAGLDPVSPEPVGPDLLEWADLIFVMERPQKTKLSKRFGASLRDKRVIVLGIPDKYRYMDPTLVKLLEARVPPHLGIINKAGS